MIAFFKIPTKGSYDLSVNDVIYLFISMCGGPGGHSHTPAPPWHDSIYA